MKSLKESQEIDISLFPYKSWAYLAYILLNFKINQVPRYKYDVMKITSVKIKTLENEDYGGTVSFLLLLVVSTE